MKRMLLTLSALCLLVGTAYATPVITKAGNTGSHLNSNLPNGGAAQGGLYSFDGTGLGPETPVTAGFPLQLNLGGVTAKMTAGGMTFDLYPIVAYSIQTTLLIPSAAPVGPAQVTITFNGETSAPFTIQIVEHAPGIFTLSTTGSGPGIFTNAANPAIINSLVASASQGDAMDIWVTGLGARSGDEAAGPVVGNIPGLNVKVYFGSIEVTPSYAGGSGCCAGLGIIRAEVPAGIEGCYVPVSTVVNGVPSNSVTMSINQGGGTCSAGPLTPEIINDAWVSGGLRVGEIDLTRISLSAAGLGTTTNDSGSATFKQYNATQLISSPGLVGNFFANNSCYVYSFNPDDEGSGTAGPEDIEPEHFLDAGPGINIMHGNASRTLNRMSTGIYSGALGSTLPIPGQQPLFLSAGSYNYNNGAGGNDVGGFTATANFPAPANWTNIDDVFNIPGGQGLDVTWTGADNSYMLIIGTSLNEGLNVGAAFICQTNGSAHKYTIPSSTIDALPPTGVIEGIPTGALLLFSVSEPQLANAPGLDALFLNYASGSGKAVSFKTQANPPTGGGDGGGNGGGSGFAVTSTGWANGGAIPVANASQACGGQNISPQLSFENAPAGTASFAVLMDDPDAGGFLHWALWGIPASATSIPAGNPGGLGVAGGNEYGEPGYGGPCPPSQHTYRIRVFALDADTTAAMQNLPAGTAAATLKPFLGAFTATALATATYTGTFGQ